VGGASALTLISGSSAAFAENKHPVSAPALIPGSADPADFEAALRSKFATGDVLNWTGGNVRLKRPIVIDVTTGLTGAGVDLNGAKIVADFNDPRQSALTIRIPAEHKNVAFRGLKIFNGSFIAESPARDAIDLVCLTNQSWIYSWKFMNLDIEALPVMACSSTAAYSRRLPRRDVLEQRPQRHDLPQRRAKKATWASSRPSPFSAARCERTAMPASRPRASYGSGAARPQHFADLFRREQGAGPQCSRRLHDGFRLRLREQRRRRYQHGQ
jgi:hypothetical protein